MRRARVLNHEFVQSNECEAMRYLLDVGRLEVVNVIGQRLIGRWK